MRKWAFGIVGAGTISDYHARAINDTPGAEIYGVCGLSIDRVKEFSAKYNCRAFADYDEMFKEEQIDIVTLATPSGVHAAPAIAAAKAGKNVLCEKPLEITLDRIDAMIEAHEKAGTQLGGILQVRFDKALDPLREAIRQGRFGTITHASVYVPWWRTDEYYTDSWHGTWKLDGGGALMNQSIHIIDTLCEMMPPVESVMAYTATLGHPRMETEDTACAVLKFSGGALGTIYGSTASYPGRFMRLEITGTKGTVIFEEDSLSVWTFAEETEEDERIRKRFGQVQSIGGESAPDQFPHTLHTVLFQEFIKSLETGEEFRINGHEARKSVQLIQAIYESSRNHKPVVLNQ